MLYTELRECIHDGVDDDRKGGVVDLEKARWYLDRLIDEEISGR